MVKTPGANFRSWSEFLGTSCIFPVYDSSTSQTLGPSTTTGSMVQGFLSLDRGAWSYALWQSNQRLWDTKYFKISSRSFKISSQSHQLAAKFGALGALGGKFRALRAKLGGIRCYVRLFQELSWEMWKQPQIFRAGGCGNQIADYGSQGWGSGRQIADSGNQVSGSKSQVL